MQRAHTQILYHFLTELQSERIQRILDAGSGKTSLTAIRAAFPAAQVDAVVYPGDERKLCTIRPMETERLSALELDLCQGELSTPYDLVVAHLLLGEAAKFSNTGQLLLERVLAIPFRYLIIIDYLEDPDVDGAMIPILCKQRKLSILKRVCVENAVPQVWADFVGTHNFGYLIRRNVSPHHGREEGSEYGGETIICAGGL